MDFYLTALLQGLCFSGIALGIYISMKIFNIPDITTDGSYTLGGVVTAIMLTQHLSTYLILPAVIVAGGIAGALTGIIHTKLKINALLSGILVNYALQSINLSLMGRSNLPLNDVSSLFSLVTISADLNINTFYILSIFVIVITMLVGYLLKTDFGITMRATGNSESMVRSLGVNTDRMKIIGLALANALTALSGYLISQFQGFADVNMGVGIVITGLGSVIIAETLINWFKVLSVWLSLILVLTGAVLFRIALSITLDFGVNPNFLMLETAVIVLAIVGLPRLNFKKN